MGTTNHRWTAANTSNVCIANPQHFEQQTETDTNAAYLRTDKRQFANIKVATRLEEAHSAIHSLLALANFLMRHAPRLTHTQHSIQSGWVCLKLQDSHETRASCICSAQGILSFKYHQLGLVLLGFPNITADTPLLFLFVSSQCLQFRATCQPRIFG